MDAWLLPRSRIGELMSALRARGYDVIGPTLREGAITYDSVERDTDLPVGLTDEQAPGRYRIVERDDQALFGFGDAVAVPAVAWLANNYLMPLVKGTFKSAPRVVQETLHG